MEPQLILSLMAHKIALGNNTHVKWLNKLITQFII